MADEAFSADVLVIGGGPAGATTALELSRAGFAVTVLESTPFPRFHVGESLLPKAMALFAQLGVSERLSREPQIHKLGAEFLSGHGKEPSSNVWFKDAFSDLPAAAFNVARAPFDAALLDAAREAGATVLEGVRVKRAKTLTDGAVTLEVERHGEVRELHARYLVDASGQSTFLGKQLGLRKVLPQLKKVAYFGHFRGVSRHAGERAGFITVVVCEEGWFWLIPLDEVTTSVGMVLDEAVARQVGVPAREMLAWGVRRCPAMAERCLHAEFPDGNGTIADFSYTCRPYCGPGFFLVGDAATFLDPIFSTGVSLGLATGIEAARAIARMLRQGSSPAAERRRYRRFVASSTEVFFHLVESYYRPEFRDLFLSEQGPFEVHRALLALLAGDVFPRLSFKVRWRIWFFDLCVFLQRTIGIVPKKETFSLLAQGEPAPGAAASVGSS